MSPGHPSCVLGSKAMFTQTKGAGSEYPVDLLYLELERERGGEGKKAGITHRGFKDPSQPLVTRTDCHI